MRVFFKKNQKIIQLNLIFAISLLGVLVIAGSAQAEGWFDIEQGFINFLAKLLSAVIGLLGTLITWAVGLVKGVIETGNPQNVSVVENGWAIVRDITNMFFILILLIIAFATILRRESYGMKSLLPKLIGVALLINFSLVLAGAVIDFANALTKSFLQDGKLFEEYLPQALGIPKYVQTTAEGGMEDKKTTWHCSLGGYSPIETAQPTKEQCEEYHEKCQGNCFSVTSSPQDAETAAAKLADHDFTYNMVMSMALSIVFMMIALFVLLSLALMFFYRILILWFLLILIPIVLLLWVLPATASMFSKWMNKFFKWTFFAPIAIFFVWLSITSWISFLNGGGSNPGGEISAGMSEIAEYSLLAQQAVPNMFLPENLIQFILVCGMLVGSLVAAQSLSIHGASGAINFGRKWGRKGAMGLAKYPAKYGLYKPAKFGKRKAEEYSARKGFEGRFQAGLQKSVGRVPGVRRGLRSARDRLEKQKDSVKQAKTKYENWSNDHIYGQYKTGNTYDKIAMAQTLAQRGKLKEKPELGFEDSDIKQATQYAYNLGVEKDILKARPELSADLAKKMGKTKQEAVDDTVKGMKPADFGNLDSNSLTPEVRNSILKQFQQGGQLGKAHLNEAAKNNIAIHNTIQGEILEPNYDSLRNDIKKYLEEGELSKDDNSKVGDLKNFLSQQGSKNPAAFDSTLNKFQAHDMPDLAKGFSGQDLPGGLKDAITRQFQQKGNWDANHLSSIMQANPELYQQIGDSLYQDFANLRQDVKDFLKSNPSRVIFHK